MDKWSEIQIFESYDDSNSTYLFMRLSGMQNALKMNKIQFHNYPQVIDKIKRLAPYQAIRYRTTMHTHSGSWQHDEWFSDIESVEQDNSAEATKALENASKIANEIIKFKIGARVHVEIYGNGLIENFEKIDSVTVLTIKFDDFEKPMKKILNLNEMKVV